jgi:hypothetical protein
MADLDEVTSQADGFGGDGMSENAARNSKSKLLNLQSRRELPNLPSAFVRLDPF